jgi:hypothetical protein
MHFATDGRKVYMKQHKNEIDMEYMGHGEREETKNREHILYRVIFCKQL